MVGRAVPRPEYPRPQFRREDWINLNGEWYFAFDDDDAGLAESWQNIAPEGLRSDGSPFGSGDAPDTPHLSELPGAALWSPEEPNLYDVRLELLGEEGAVLDTVESYFGMRKIEVQGDEVLLNGRHLYQRLVLDQGYFPEGILTAPTDDDLRRDVELAKEMGFNGVRKHQKVEDPRWLHWADTLGLLAWGARSSSNATRH